MSGSLKRPSVSVDASGPAATGVMGCSISPLTDLPVDLLRICLSQTMCSPDGGVSLSLLARTCAVFGKADKKGKLPLVSQYAQELCKEAGVRRLPLTMGDRWCWPRMLSWLSQAVRVGAQCELKTIHEGVAAAAWQQYATEASGRALPEGSVLVLVEPGVYEEGGLIGRGQEGDEDENLDSEEEEEEDEDEDGGGEKLIQRVSFWGCERESVSGKGEMQKVKWVSSNVYTLLVRGAATVGVNGITMEAAGDDDGGEFTCVCAEGASTLSLERCDLTCDGAAVIGVSGQGTTAAISRCGIHHGKEGGVLIIDGASATLENNDIHSNAKAGVQVLHEGSHAVLRNNRIHSGKEDGVLIIKRAAATLENNDIHSNTMAGVQVHNEGCKATLKGNRIHDCKEEGVLISDKGCATLENNIIADNDLTGVNIDGYCAATLTGNTIKGNGQCKVERAGRALGRWPAHFTACYRSASGFPGVMAVDHSTVTGINEFPGSNTIDGNGKVGSTGEQVSTDGTSSCRFL